MHSERNSLKLRGTRKTLKATHKVLVSLLMSNYICSKNWILNILDLVGLEMVERHQENLGILRKFDTD